MNIIDATNNMLNGKRMVRAGMNGMYIAILPGNTYMWSLPTSNMQATVNASIYVPSKDDILADDWKVLT